ncbi:hypothetical protein F7R03_32730, partial [Pseudomonas palleroniana]
PLWELSLLAIAVGQAALKLNVPPSSRASSAPTLIPGAHGIGVHRQPLWELSLLAIAVGQAALKLNVPPSSRASSAPTLIPGAHGIGV